MKIVRHPNIVRLYEVSMFPCICEICFLSCLHHRLSDAGSSLLSLCFRDVGLGKSFENIYSFGVCDRRRTL